MRNLFIKEKIKNFIREYSSCEINRYWYPLVELKKDIDVSAYDIDKIYSNGDVLLLKTVLKKCNITSVNMFQMDHSEFFENEDIDLLLYEKYENKFVFPYVTETFYYDSTKSWLVYVSHEETICFTGEKLVKIAKDIIPDNYKY